MKHYLKYFFILIYPYWIYIGIRIWSYGVNKLELILFLLPIPVAAFLSSICLIISSLKNQLNARKLIYSNFIFKLLHIPTYFLLLLYIVMSAGQQLYDRNSAFDFAMILNSILVLITGLYGIAAIISAIKERQHSKFLIPVFIILGLGQFILIIDVLAALILLIVYKISNRQVRRLG